MICFGCSLTSICKVFEMVHSMSPSIHITVHDCRMRAKSEQTVAAAPVPVPVAEPVMRSPEELSSISDRIKAASKKADPVVAAADQAVEKLTVHCADCDAKIMEPLAIKCTACGKVLCESCVTHEMGTKKPFCEECWDKHDPAPLT